jgi:uncharacterized protein
MKNSVVSLDNIRDLELNRLQSELMDFATYQHEDFLYELVAEMLDDRDVEEDEGEVLVFYLTMWVIFSVQYDGEETIIEQFINMKKRENKLRSSTITQLESWANTAPSYSIVTKIIDDVHLEIEDVFTNERKAVKLLEKDEELEVGGSILGFLLPYGNYDIYFTMFIDFEEDETSAIVSEIREHFAEGEFDHVEDFMRTVFPGLLLAIFFGDLDDEPDIEQLEWEDPKHEEVATLYRKRLEEEELPKQFQDLGVMLWYLFCTKEKPVFRKSEIYAAALHYFIDKNIPFLELYTQGELAEIYGVSAGSLSKAYRHLEKGLEDEMDRLHEYMKQDESSIDFDDVTFEDIFDGDDFDDENVIDLEDLIIETNTLPFSKKRK